MGGLAVGLAGREILENLFTGLIILSSSPFEVGDEVLFAASGNVSTPLVLQGAYALTLLWTVQHEVFFAASGIMSPPTLACCASKAGHACFHYLPCLAFLLLFAFQALPCRALLRSPCTRSSS